MAHPCLCKAFSRFDPRHLRVVKAQRFEFNIAARNGVWNAFRLIDLTTREVAAWFLAHPGVDSEREVDKILRISGSPYEPDGGSIFNDDKTAAESVFVINRYDRGYYDKRSRDEIVAAEEVDEEQFASTGRVTDQLDCLAKKTVLYR